mmetsp:Transcript_4801/g.10620  ORF Transcript_4801/g.10620 Transcript_4801/m.10620 type:complete len:450 (-) Transcript_4801:174-1523(-)
MDEESVGSNSVATDNSNQSVSPDGDEDSIGTTGDAAVEKGAGEAGNDNDDTSGTAFLPDGPEIIDGDGPPALATGVAEAMLDSTPPASAASAEEATARLSGIIEQIGIDITSSTKQKLSEALEAIATEARATDEGVAIKRGKSRKSHDQTRGNERRVRQRTNGPNIQRRPRGTNPSSSRSGVGQPNVEKPSSHNIYTHNESHRRNQIRGFVKHNQVRSPAHETGLVGILQLARGHPDGIYGALGHGNRKIWVSSNLDALFADNGPLRAFVPCTVESMMAHIRRAQEVALIISRTQDPLGSAQRTLPQWVRLFQQLELQQENPLARPSSSPQTSSPTNPQIPPRYQGDDPANLRTETPHNFWAPHMVQQVMASMNQLTNAISQAVVAPPAAPPRTMMDVANDYAATRALLSGSTIDVDQNFYESTLEGLRAELTALRANNNASNESGEEV